MRTFTEAELRDIIKKHGMWLRGEKGGERANLYSADLSSADLRNANLRSADLSNANLRSADLSSADLSSANLRNADLRNANLRNANLRSANLRSANLNSAEGITPERTTPLLILLEQPGKIRAYKLVNSDFKSPIQNSGKLTYRVGDILEVPDANTDPLQQCAAGINLCTLDWCLRAWKDGYHIMVCEFTAKDIAVIPTATDGKFRVRKCKVIREYDPTPIFEREKAEREAVAPEERGDG